VRFPRGSPIGGANSAHLRPGGNPGDSHSPSALFWEKRPRGDWRGPSAGLVLMGVGLAILPGSRVDLGASIESAVSGRFALGRGGVWGDGFFRS